MCDLETNLCTAGWLDDVSDLIDNGEKTALEIAETIKTNLEEEVAAEALAAGTIVQLADIMADLIDLRDNQTAMGIGGGGQEEAVEFAEAVLTSVAGVLAAYEGWRGIFNLDTRYQAASAYLR